MNRRYLGVVLAAGMLWGCGGGGGNTGSGAAGGGGTGATGGTAGTGGTGGTGGAPVACEEASEGDKCAGAGDKCDIPCSNCELVCGQDLVWAQDCHGCPESAPAPGEDCDPCLVTGSCDYAVDSGCGTIQTTASCDQDSMTWVFSGETCPDDCYAAATEEACKAGLACRWLTPGCAEMPLPSAGCFPAAECSTSDDCTGGRTCQTANYNPCYKLGCDACGAETHVCLP